MRTAAGSRQSVAERAGRRRASLTNAHAVRPVPLLRPPGRALTVGFVSGRVPLVLPRVPTRARPRNPLISSAVSITSTYSLPLLFITGITSSPSAFARPTTLDSSLSRAPRAPEVSPGANEPHVTLKTALPNQSLSLNLTNVHRYCARSSLLGTKRTTAGRWTPEPLLPDRPGRSAAPCTTQS